jgi:hypothetical protein
LQSASLAESFNARTQVSNETHLPVVDTQETGKSAGTQQRGFVAVTALTFASLAS